MRNYHIRRKHGIHKAKGEYMTATKAGNQLTSALAIRRKNKRTSIGHSKNSRPKHKHSGYNSKTKNCNK